MNKVLLHLFLIVFLVGCGNLHFVPEPEVDTFTEKPFQKVSLNPDINGYDVLGVAKYCDTFLKSKHLPGMSTLLNTFGDPLPCVRKRAELGGLELVQVDLIDATCWRNNNCPPGAKKPTDLNEIEKRAKRVRRLALDYPTTEFWLSPALEHDVRNADMVRLMLKAAQKGCPECNVINSPYTGAKPDGYKIEKHGTRVSAFSVSGDGNSSFDADNLDSDGNNFNHSNSGFLSTFMWFPELNLRCTGEEEAPPPKERTERPEQWMFRQAYLLTHPEQSIPEAPNVCTSIRKFRDGEILKTNAESYCNNQPGEGDPRGNKPLLIIKKSGKAGSKLHVLNSKGKEVGCFLYYGPYSTRPYHRWYMGTCSRQNPVQLYDALGGEWGFINFGQGQCLLINAIRRMGVYR